MGEIIMYLYTYENLLECAKTEKGKEYIEKVRECYEKEYANKPINALLFSKFKLFHTTGNRGDYERDYFDKRKRLMLLQILAFADDKYIDPLEDIIAAICDEITWCVPAHCLIADYSLTYDYKRTDLFASETGMYLAETAYILKDKLSNEIKHRIEYALKDKIVDVFESKEQNFERGINNWLAVCGGAVGTVYLYSFPERFDIVKDRILGALQKYVDNLGSDGYCSEGLGYWIYGFGSFALFYDVYTQITGEWPEILDSETVKNTLNFTKNTIFGKGVTLPFADGGRNGGVRDRIAIAVTNRLFGTNITITDEVNIPDREALGLRYLYCLTLPKKAQNETVGDCFYKEHQVLIKRKSDYIFVSKGGTNDEMHNHNDIGTFAIFRNGIQYIVDPGCGEYTLRYFSKGEYRYSKEIFVCSAYAHSIPVIDDTIQTWGEEYHATVLDRTDDYIEYDLSKAYPIDVEKLTVKYSFLDNGVSAVYDAKFKQSAIYRFISFIEPKVDGNKVYLNDMVIENSYGVIPTVERVDYKDHSTQIATAFVIDYKVTKCGLAEFKFLF